MNGVFIYQQLIALEELGHQCDVVQTYKWFPPFGLHKFHPYWQEGYAKFSDFTKVNKVSRIHKVPVFVKMPDRIFNADPYQREAMSIYKYLSKKRLLDKIDVIYANFYTETALVGTYLKRLTGKPLISIARGDDVHAWPQENPNLLTHIKAVFEHSDVLLANSRKLAKDAKDLMPAFSKDVEVVYNGIDTDKFKPVSKNVKEELIKQLNLPTNKKLLLCVATPVKLKGWIELFDAIASNHSVFEDWVLVCIAPNRNFPDKLDLIAEAEARGLVDRIVVVGQVDHSRLIAYYQAADAFVLPSYNEGLANVVLEAAATNLPLLVTDVGGHREVFETSKSTLLFPPKDTAAISKSMSEFLSNQAYLTSDTRKVVMDNVGNYQKNAALLITHFEKAIG